ncbi:SDR family NAD(P)-dependent oxidoreductase [Limnochorda pilosa]|uniref:Short-chain dehydrogenase n=1 Tax=Limnochorda pilosa TaxID=1555112 RepID=A0A0K2SLU6_LIMPI|nr:SDR family oxidoreductase [Limnochorda pilosa]BAS27794.1 short-chain dehydrogenase [Limnochorda pilosa]
MIIERASVDRTVLQGKVAIVTGAGRGIGRETARILARLGAATVLAELSDEGLEVERLIRSGGGEALFVRTDVSDSESVEHLRDQALRAFGRADVLVNNAAFVTTKPVLEHRLEEWDRVFAVNLRGAFLGVKAFLPGMLERGEGVVVFMESAEGMPYLAPYLASKTGLRSLASSLAQEIGEGCGVAVYGFAPGMVETPGLMDAMRHLAPLYGLSLDGFIRQSGGQVIPAELCATGLVGTLLHAAEFHGQEADYVAGLAALGLDSDGKPHARLASPEAVAAEVRTGTVEPTSHASARVPRPPADLGDLLHEALALNERMEAIIEENVREYAELTAFQRPIVRRMFLQGTGLKVEEWLARAQEMTQRLRAALAQEAGTGSPQLPGLAPRNLAAYADQLRRMCEYVGKQESQARGWIRDPQVLETALRALEERKVTSATLAALIQRLADGPADDGS